MSHQFRHDLKMKESIVALLIVLQSMSHFYGSRPLYKLFSQQFMLAIFRDNGENSQVGKLAQIPIDGAGFWWNGSSLNTAAIKRFCDDCDSISAQESAAKWLLFYFIRELTKSSLEVRLLSEDSVQQARLCTKIFFMYVKVIHLLHTIFETDDTIITASKR